MKALRIVPNEIEDGELYCRTQGTEVYSGDEQVHGVERVDIRIEANDIIRATMKLSCWFREISGAEPEVQITHPFNNEIVRVAKIVLVGGEVINCLPETETTNLSSTAREFQLSRICK